MSGFHAGCQDTSTRYGSDSPYSPNQHTGEREEVDFTEVKPGKYGYKYLFAFIDIFSGWVECFPKEKETASTVAKKLLDEIVPRYGVPETIVQTTACHLSGNLCKNWLKSWGQNGNYIVNTIPKV